jgi:protein-S-isoprenylcysteine O-methyltransferase Ste14
MKGRTLAAGFGATVAAVVAVVVIVVVVLSKSDKDSNRNTSTPSAVECWYVLIFPLGGLCWLCYKQRRNTNYPTTVACPKEHDVLSER